MQTQTSRWLSVALVLAAVVPAADARIKLVALPDRGPTVIRLDNPAGTLIEEERVLTLQKGVNQVDFSWNGVSLDVDSIRLTMLSHPEQVTLLNVSFPPNEAALVWEIASQEAWEERARISYVLHHVDRLVTYRAVANKEETKADLQSHVILRNFSGEDFASARVLLDYGEAFESGIAHEETKQLLFFRAAEVPVEKMWTWDSGKQPWAPERVSGNVGIPVHYQVKNVKESGLGAEALWGGKVRVYQADGREGTIVLGEDTLELVPVGEKAEIYIGDSRDLVVTQRKMRENRINLRRNNNNQVVLYDTDEEITAKLENFKDQPATLTVIQHIPGEWRMLKCSHEYEREDASTLKFKVVLPPRGHETLAMHYNRLNLR